MGLCQSRHSRSSLNSALIGDLEYDGGDDYKKVETDDEKLNKILNILKEYETSRN